MRVHAGLGNQMFQYAAGLGLAFRNKTKLFLDISGYEVDTFRHYQLDSFCISGAIMGKRLNSWAAQLRRRRYMPLWLSLRAINCPLALERIVDLEEGFDERIARAGDNLYLDGFWQNERYFSDIRSVLLQEFTIKNSINTANKQVLSEILSCNAVCIHVRRGDYVTTLHGQTKHGTCPMDYYRDAIAYFQKRLTNPIFFAFSDDPEWVTSQFSGIRSVNVVSHNDKISGIEDLRLMMNCQHFIIANSSFSWWAAWLSQNTNKVVVAPKQWGLGLTKGYQEIVPDDWIKM